MCRKCHNGSYDGTVEQMNHDPNLVRMLNPWLFIELIWWPLVKLCLIELKVSLKKIFSDEVNMSIDNIPQKPHCLHYEGDEDQMNYASPWLVLGVIMWLVAKGELWTALQAVWICIKTAVKELVSRCDVHES